MEKMERKTAKRKEKAEKKKKKKSPSKNKPTEETNPKPDTKSICNGVIGGNGNRKERLYTCQAVKKDGKMMVNSKLDDGTAISLDIGSSKPIKGKTLTLNNINSILEDEFSIIKPVRKQSKHLVGSESENTDQ